MAPPFLVNMTADHHINGDSVLHEYEYEQDSDLDEEEEGDLDNDIELQFNSVPAEFQTGSSSQPHIPSKHPPSFDVPGLINNENQQARHKKGSMVVWRTNYRQNHPPTPSVAVG